MQKYFYSVTLGATREAVTVYPSGAHQFNPCFSGVRVTRYLFLCSVLYIIVCSFFLFHRHCIVCSSSIYHLGLLFWYIYDFRSNNA